MPKLIDRLPAPLANRMRTRAGTQFVRFAMVAVLSLGASEIALFAFILVCTGIIVMRFKDPTRARPFRVPLGPVLLPSLGLLSCLFLVAYLPPSSWMRFVGWLAAGLVIYGLYGYRHSTLRAQRLP